MSGWASCTDRALPSSAPQSRSSESRCPRPKAASTPVIAPRAGAAPEVVCEGTTGILLERIDPGSIAWAVRAVASRGFDANAYRVSVERFGERRFLEALHGVLSEEQTVADPACRRALVRAETARGAA
jgi:glycosyltransferase involved in cell wall biosynthesis